MGYNSIKGFHDYYLIKEGKIPMYVPGDNLKASKSMRVVDVHRDFKKLLDAGTPFTVIVNTEGMKNVDHLKPEMDVISVEDDNLHLKVRDHKGNEHRIKSGKIEEIGIGNSVKDKVWLNIAYFVDGKERMRVKDFDGKEVTVMVHGDGVRKYPLADWKKMNKYEVD
jgi:hypothetical protein